MMKRVPVLLQHDTSGTPIGTLELDMARMPPGFDWTIGTAYRVIEKDSAGRIMVGELLEVSIILPPPAQPAHYLHFEECNLRWVNGESHRCSRPKGHAGKHRCICYVEAE